MRDLRQKLELEHELELDQIKQKETSHQDDQVYIPREGGDIGLFITLVPKFYINVFLFVASTTEGTLIEFLLFLY